MSHLNGIGPSRKDPKFEAWDEEDLKVMSKLWNNLVPKINDTCMFLDTTKDVWDSVCETYSKVNEDVRCKIGYSFCHRVLKLFEGTVAGDGPLSRHTNDVQ